MKRNHIAIAGILASVLVTVDAAWAATDTDTGTVIASQAYVDAKVGTKLNSSALNAGTLSTSSTTTVPSEKTVSDAITSAVSGIDTSAPAATTYIIDNATSAKSISSNDTDKAPSVRAVKNMVRASTATGGGVRATDSASDVLVPTEKAVATALVEKINNVANTNTNAIIATENKFAANPAIQKGVLYIKGDGLANHSATSGLDTITAAHSWTTADGANNSIKTIRESNKMDDYVPTVAAVEARVKAAEGTIPNGDLASLNAVSGGAGGTITDNTITNDDIKSNAAIALSKLGTLASYSKPNSAGTVATGDSVQTAIGKLDKAIDGKAAKATGLSAATTKYNTVKYNADGVVIAGNDLTALADVNSTSGASCDENNPCVLTYYKKSGATFMRWTPMMTESASANTSATTSGDTAASS